jgi:hypothetical protein
MCKSHWSEDGRSRIGEDFAREILLFASISKNENYLQKRAYLWVNTSIKNERRCKPVSLFTSVNAPSHAFRPSCRSSHHWPITVKRLSSYTQKERLGWSPNQSGSIQDSLLANVLERGQPGLTYRADRLGGLDSGGVSRSLRAERGGNLRDFGGDELGLGPVARISSEF